MSMFYELMMRKKEIMYATIKGTLTENDGVFSGFSGSNYLALQQPFKLNADTVAEFCFKINLDSVGTTSIPIGSPSEYSLLLAVSSDTKLTLYMGNVISSWNILSEKKGTTLLQANTDYYIRLLINKGNITLLLSTDNINWTTEFSVDVTIPEEYTYNLGYGRGRITSQYLCGSIDLNKSYIKLGSTKYKLQAVVGYTIVGSPTIVDGVLSNTSSSNYIKTPNFPEYSSLEAEVVTTISSATSNFQSIFALTGNYAMVFEYRNTVGIRYRIYNNSATEVYSGTYNIVVNQPITINLKIKGNNAVITIIQNGTIKFQSSHSITRITGNSRFQLGYCWQGLTTGSIDLNKTFVKLDNKLWFNGQEG